MADLEPTEALIALLRDVRDRHVLEDPDTCAPYLDLVGEDDRADVSRSVWAMANVQPPWCWLPPDTLVWHLTDRGREVLDRGAL